MSVGFKKTDSGFSLIETLVAIIILITALLGPLTLAIYSIRNASLSQNEIIAYNLAQEAMELVRNQRDTNFIAGLGATWASQGLAACFSGGGCGVEALTGSFQTCSVLNNCIIKFDSTSGLYGHTTGSDTIFTRQILMNDVDDYDSPHDGVIDEVKVTVTVSWPERLYNKKLTLEMHLFKWK